MSDDEWKLVESEDELHPGMCVELRPCVWCGRRERIILGKEDPRGTVGLDEDHNIVPLSRSFRFATRDCGGDRFEGGDLEGAIRERRAYRLVDPPVASEDTISQRRPRRVPLRAS